MSGWIACVRHLVAAAAAGLGLSIVVLASPDRRRRTARALLDRQRDAVAAIERRAYADAGRAITTLTEDATTLPAAIRNELVETAKRLAAARPGDVLDHAPILALLERVQKALTGEVALGLDVPGRLQPVEAQGRSGLRRPRHRDGPGTAPISPAGLRSAPRRRSPSRKATRLTAKTYGGGPTKDHILESTGSGVALLDYDGDGRLDIYLVTAASLTPGARARAPPQRPLPQPRRLAVRGRVGAGRRGRGGVGQRRLRRRRRRRRPRSTSTSPTGARTSCTATRATGRFEDIAARAGVAAGGWSTGCTFFDADADGDLDLYVARYVETTWDDARARARGRCVWRNGPKIMVGPAGLPGEADLFFENRGGGRFVEAAEAHGLADRGKAYGFGVVATDYDDDGAVDLFVANDSNPNFLYRNRGDGRFESVGLVAGVAVNAEARAQAGMGVDAGDYDGDGRIDLMLTAFAHDRNALYRNLDRPDFEDATMPAGLAGATFERMGWGTAFLDADLDGRLDLFVANGHIFADVDAFPALGETYAQKNQLLLNEGARFRDVSAAAGAGLQIAQVGRGLAVGDLDDDGDPDVVVSNMDDVPTVLENRQRTGHHWIGVRVDGARRQPVRDRRAGHGRGRRPAAGPRDPLGRQLPLAGRPARPRRARRRTPARSSSRCGCRAARAGASATWRSIAFTRSRLEGPGER